MVSKMSEVNGLALRLEFTFQNFVKTEVLFREICANLLFFVTFASFVKFANLILPGFLFLQEI